MANYYGKMVLQAQAKVLRKVNGHRFNCGNLEVETKVEGSFAPICYVRIRKAGAKSMFLEIGYFYAGDLMSITEAETLASKTVKEKIVDVAKKIK